MCSAHTLAGQVPGDLGPRRLETEEGCGAQMCILLLLAFRHVSPSIGVPLTLGLPTPLARCRLACLPVRGCFPSPRPSVLSHLCHGGTTTPCTHWPCALGSCCTLLPLFNHELFKSNTLLFLLIIFLFCASYGTLWPFRNI